ncbi:Hpt domain-containing protein [Adlercreutzia sp. CNCM I-6216]
MSLEIAYAAMGGDLETVRGRLLTDERIEKFAKIFLQDTSMQTLESALEAGDLPEAYRGAHTLKGVSRDLGFTPLFEAAALSDALRLDDAGVPANMEAVPELMPAVRDAYALVVDSIAII